MTDHDRSLQGIGGWLTLVALGLIVTPPRIVIGMILEYMPAVLDGSLSLLIDPTSPSFSPLSVLVIVFEVAVNLGLAVFGVALTVLMFRRSRSFPSWFIVFLLSGLTFTVVDTALPGLFGSHEPRFDIETVIGLMRQGVICSIWISYMLVSERVEATFRPSESGGQPGAESTEAMFPGDTSSSKKRLATVGGVALAAFAVVGVAVALVFSAAALSAGNAPTVDSISFDTAGWKELERIGHYVVWSNECGDALSLAAGPKIEIDTSNPAGAIRSAREVAAYLGGSLVSADLVVVDSWPALEMIFKKEEGLGYAYEGAIFFTLPTRDIMVYAVFHEHGTTGVREAIVTAQLVESGEIEIDSFHESGTGDGAQPIERWFVDPYDRNFEGPVLASLSDNVEYDVAFPDHPLSALRRTLATVRATMVIEGE